MWLEFLWCKKFVMQSSRGILMTLHATEHAIFENVCVCLRSKTSITAFSEAHYDDASFFELHFSKLNQHNQSQVSAISCISAWRSDCTKNVFHLFLASISALGFSGGFFHWTSKNSHSRRERRENKVNF